MCDIFLVCTLVDNLAESVRGISVARAYLFQNIIMNIVTDKHMLKLSNVVVLN